MYINKTAGYVNHIDSTRKSEKQINKESNSAITISSLIMAGVMILAVILS